MVWIRIIALQLVLIHSAWSMVLKRRSAETTSSAASYLSKYGYLTQSSSKETSSLVDITKAVKDFQVFAGLAPTGELDELTIDLMSRPRCGVKDIVNDAELQTEERHDDAKRFRTKRYALQGSRWRVKDLTYRISKYPKKLSKADVDRTMRKAFDVWERVTDLKFEEKSSGKVHIDIRFERRNHGDDDPFDGEGGTLAHAFFPVFGGDAHFDEEEDWTVDTPRGTSLLMSAAHELGHSLGLSHSNDRTALMAPFYRGYEENVSLARDDIEGIEALYGEKDDGRSDDEVKNEVESGEDDGGIFSDFFPRSATSTTTRRPTTRRTTRRTSPPPRVPVNNRALCGDGEVDAMVTLQNDTTYAFKGTQYWKLTETSIEPGYPRSIQRDWGMPGNMDAAFTWTNGRTYFFKGSRYWRFTDGTLDDGYPKGMDVGFGGIPSNVDAAMVWPANNKIYFFKGNKYWKFDPKTTPPVSDSYPREISNWDGIPNNLDSAIRYSNDKIYFFKDGKYYRWNDDTFSVDNGNPAYPRDTGFWWFGCKNSPLRF